MALYSSRADCQVRQPNKEPEWSSLCNNVFDQYLDHDDPFCFDGDQRGRTSSNDSVNLFDFSASSEQSHQTDATSPIPSWDLPIHNKGAEEIEKAHPKPRESVDFWTKTLRALEQNATECELKQHKLRSTKSHPDFLSLGGYPSPPAVPSSPIDQSLSAQRRVSRSAVAANGKKRNIAARSVSRGRPSGVSKPAIAGSVNPSATVRKCSASPAKTIATMMNPSRYRAGFKDVWSEKLHTSPEKFGIRVPNSAVTFSPPPSGGLMGEDYAVFGSPTENYAQTSFAGGYDDLSPLTSTFQQAHIHTPIASPLSTNAAAHASNGYFGEAFSPVPTTNPYAAQKVPLNDTASLFPERTSSLAPNRTHDFDFGFDTSAHIDPFDTTSFDTPLSPNYITQVSTFDPFGGIDASILPTTETADFSSNGLGISCDPFQPSGMTSPANNINFIQPAALHQRGQSVPAPYYVQRISHGLPSTPHRGRTHQRSQSHARSQSPSPTPVTEPRSAKRATGSSRHRRTKSATSMPRHASTSRPRGVGGGGGGFVNFTPSDHGKILNGVAPSGSSKTKARREKEAQDKRRRLSQAAMKAVVDAGGDLGVLRREGAFLM